MPGIEICRAFFFIHTKKNYFRSSVSEEEIHMKNSYFVYFLLIILSACNDKKSGTASLNGEIKGLGNDTIYIYMGWMRCMTVWIRYLLKTTNFQKQSL